MKIGLVGDVPPPCGGIAIHVEGLRDRLRAEGWEVHVVDATHHHTRIGFLAEMSALAARGYLLHVHSSGHNPGAWMRVAAASLASQVGRGLVATIHSGLTPGYLAGEPGRKRAARAALIGVQRIIAVSAGVRDALVDAHIEPRRIEVLPAFLGVETPGPAPAAFAQARAAHAPLLACAVAPSPVYGARHLWAGLNLLRRTFPTAGCVCFGPGSEQLAGAVREAGLQGAVHLLGEIDHVSALGVLQSCDAFVRPTLSDGDALSVREALALGAPVVASDAVERPAGVERFRAGDPFELAQQVVAVLAQPRPARGDAGRAAGSFPALLRIYGELGAMRTGNGTPGRLGDVWNSGTGVGTHLEGRT